MIKSRLSYTDVRVSRLNFFKYSCCQDVAKYQYRLQSTKACLRQLNHCTNIETADLVFSALKKNSNQTLPVKVFKKLLSLAAKERNVDKCKDILWELNHREIKPSIEIYNAALNVAERAKALKLAMDIWDQINAVYITPNQTTYKILFSILSKPPIMELPTEFPLERIQQGEKLLKDMMERGLEPKLDTYIVFIRLLGEAGLLDRVFEIETEIERRGLVRNAMLYAVIMKACKRADNFEDAVRYFSKSKKLGFLDSALCNTALEAFHSLSMFEQVESTWKSMPKLKVKRDSSGFCVLMKSFANQGRVADILAEVDKVKFTLNEVFYSSIIHELYHRGFVEESITMFKKGYNSGMIRVHEEDQNKLNLLDLHVHNTAVACCAVRYFLMKRAREQNGNDFKIIVGRQIHSGSTCSLSLGDVIRDLLKELGLSFEERSLGGLLVVLGCEVKWLSHVPIWKLT